MVSDEEYVPVKTRAYLAIAFIGGQGLIAFAMLSCLGAYFVDPETQIANQPLWLTAHDLLSSIRSLLFLGGVVCFLIWLHRAHKNLQSLRAQHLEFTPGWAVGWWFVPFANLVKPFQVVREVWCESDPSVPDGPSFLAASLHSAPVYMGFWWAAWILMNVVGNIVNIALNTTPATRDEAYLALYLIAAFDFAILIASAITAYMIWDVTRRQELRASRIDPVAPSTPPPPPTFGPEDRL